jgi:hypothetical protein
MHAPALHCVYAGAQLPSGHGLQGTGTGGQSLLVWHMAVLHPDPKSAPHGPSGPRQHGFAVCDTGGQFSGVHVGGGGGGGGGGQSADCRQMPPVQRITMGSQEPGGVFQHCMQGIPESGQSESVRHIGSMQRTVPGLIPHGPFGLTQHPSNVPLPGQVAGSQLATDPPSLPDPPIVRPPTLPPPTLRPPAPGLAPPTPLVPAPLPLPPLEVSDPTCPPQAAMTSAPREAKTIRNGTAYP